MTVYHNHHIIPLHINGPDTPKNLIKLTIEEHALAHKKLWEEHGRWQDKLAWRSLSGQITHAEASQMARRMGQLGRIKTIEERNKISLSKKGKPNLKLKGYKHTEEFKRKISMSHIGKKLSQNTKNQMSKTHTGMKYSPYHCQRITEGLMGHKHSQTTKNKISNKRSQTWVVINPQGKSFEITNLHKFCKENDLYTANLHRVAYGKANHHKGWKCEKII